MSALYRLHPSPSAQSSQLQFLLRSSSLPLWRASFTQKRFDSSSPANRPPPPPLQQSDVDDTPEKYPSTAAYKPFIRPFAKVFLGAMFTYQVLYWCWEKLRLDEIKKEKLAEVRQLEAQVEEYKQKRAAGLTTGSGAGRNATGQGSIFSKIRSWF